MLSRISWLPVKCAFLGLLGFHGKDLEGGEDLFSYPTPYDPTVESYVSRNGLNETHLHLNGSTPAELIWLRAMVDPGRELMDFFNSYRGEEKVRELCFSVDETLSPEILLRRCRLARQLRAFLIAFSRRCEEGKNYPSPFFLSVKEPLPYTFSSTVLFEEKWQIDALNRLRKEPQIYADRAFHLYLLLKGQFLQLLVQREDLFGFDEFQKVTLQELREPEETQFCRRFRQFHGVAGRKSEIDLLEGRFSPKVSRYKNERLLLAIFNGYADYMSDHSDVEAAPSRSKAQSLSGLLREVSDLEKKSTGCLSLSLVAHFIKKRWVPQKDGYYFDSLRRDLTERALVLRDTLRQWPDLKGWIRGVDAASNEMDAPPEVFASVFRLCRRFGLEQVTYHVGEDFIHLAGGIRQIDDGLRFLELKPCDRLGHCTALGMHPRQWLDTMPGSIVLPKGEAFLDALSAWRYFRYKNNGTASRLDSVALRLGCEIFQKNLSLESLDRIMELRHLDPQFVYSAVTDRSWSWRTVSLDDDIRKEAKLVWQIREKEGNIRLEPLNRWWRDEELLERAWKDYVEVRSDFLDVQELAAYQQAVLSEISRKRLVIETLPTSNVRISQYRDMRDHHVFRWMGIPNRSLDGDPAVMVSLGTDDPGIFASSLKGEFYHLYLVLRQDLGLPDHEAMDYLKRLNERGFEYSFHLKK
ncbi:hypothetical protein L2W58_08715 [Dethiosulfovibrio sp. F2B]|uniref:hypothetical protein n=1 Tax=Dethiosulfovibrio faecalis TaxID=2720018 RepID=UPI001F242F22|nr:hypothetical protein [Dethiosulfovibrio faecalis]MCF4151877.1 hypothetical protein [Dethiosulfovibrio faecalis]